MAWKMTLWARLDDDNRANKTFKGYPDEQSCRQPFALCGKSLKVDGTLGVTAAINEMLMQSHEGFIRLLPAFPDEWKTGELKGARARGGFELDFQWIEKKVTKLKILSTTGSVFRFKIDRPVEVVSNGQKRSVKISADGIVEFSTIKGNIYVLQTQN